MVKTRKVYLDHNATTPLHPEVKKMIISAMEVFGNPSSLHQFGGRRVSSLKIRVKKSQHLLMLVRKKLYLWVAAPKRIIP